MQLERTHIRTWADLANAFLKHYKYNLDMAPTPMQLQNLSQKKEESFKEYAQRWRELASRVQPPLLEKELVDTFIRILQGLYYEKMVRSISSGFSELVTIGKRIETRIKSGKISRGPSNSPYNSRRPASNVPPKKEGEINVVALQSRVQQPLVIPQGQQQGRRPRRNFDPLWMPPSELLQQLVKHP
ncbi:unnamed protein product [Vicia faba]|uniref:Retrotransposon gag domain-containing protein n=1 Tax=Vicia faba TaxID=3906 RepID=A0AAV0YNY9_VICFA|nr:unnamed protein product [Vicia faba]